ncbi:MAG: anti-sigma factor family protein [Gemmatimonadales bacterium]
MSHVDDGTLHAYLDGELSALEVTRVEAHVAECAPCRARLDEERDVIARASRILALAEPPEQAAPPLHSLRHRRLGWRVRWPPLAWAATLVLAIGVGWFVRGGVPRGEETAPDSAAPAARAETAPVDPPVATTALAQREAPAPAPAPPEQAPPEVAAAAGPPAQEPRVDSLAVRLGRAAPDTTTRVALEARMRNAAARQDTAARIAQEAAALLGERAARPAVALDGVLITDTLELDEARALIGGAVYAVSGLPIRSIMLGRFIGYEGIVVVEQELDSNTVIRVETRRPATVHLDAVVVTGAAEPRPPSPDSPAARVRIRGATGLPAAPVRPPVTRQVAGLEVSITGSLAADSLRALLAKAAPIR